MDAHLLTAREAAGLLATGRLTSEALVAACLDRIAAEEPRIRAFAYLDPQLALAQARTADARGRPGCLHGLPVGVKDIVDTADMPTARGSALFEGRRPALDAACVAALRHAGAVILGKTVTTELAYYAPGATRNPRDPSRTPGGSSSGSAAAVAAAMVPAALGSQTAGSLIRPASYCGVVGYKPSHGLVRLDGVTPLAPTSLDTLGILARAAADLPLLAEALGIPLGPAAPAEGEVGGGLRVGVCRTEAWTAAAPESRAAVDYAADRLSRAGARVGEEGERFDGLGEAQGEVMAFEATGAYRSLGPKERERLSSQFRDLLAKGEATPPSVYARALALRDRARARLSGVFGRFDVLLTPSAPGEAPEGLLSTGDPALNRIWTFLGVPCLSLPGAKGPHGLPVGVQLVGPRGADGMLLAAALFAEGVLLG
ncbi:MAG TPA: amidase [Anaeromyxobacteraceae bacterium]|nr:amidase [Anaeromyxobacteraceae bacterium]